MGADTREHGVLIGGSRYRRIIVICTWSRSADTIAFVPLFNIIRNDRWKSGERRYIGQNHLHVHVPNACQKRERHVIGHIHLGCRTRTIPVSILLRSARHALRTREGSSTLLGHGVDRSHGHPAFLLPRHSSRRPTVWHTVWTWIWRPRM